MSDKLKTWQDLPAGGIITEAGNSASYETGTWRSRRPVWTAAACIHCLTCWVYCPEDAFKLIDGRTASGKTRRMISGIDYFYCKGCGLCARECPVNRKGKKTALEMRQEEK